MRRLSDEIIQFFHNQGYVIVSTLDKDGTPHNSCKGIIEIKQNGRIYLLDVYRGNTYNNLRRNPNISVTAVDEHKFKGHCLKGRAKIVSKEKLPLRISKAWNDKITSRITQRLIKNIHEKKGHPRHPEALLPKPEYLIVMDVEEIVDLTPYHLR